MSAADAHLELAHVFFIDIVAMNEVLQRLKQRKLVQWAIAYVLAAFALWPGIDKVAQRFGCRH